MNEILGYIIPTNIVLYYIIKAAAFVICNNNMEKDTSPAKRKRSASPHCEPNLRDTNISQNEEEQDGMENIDCGGLEKSEVDDISSKRQKLIPQGGEVTLNGQSGQLRRSPSG